MRNRHVIYSEAMQRGLAHFLEAEEAFQQYHKNFKAKHFNARNWALQQALVAFKACYTQRAKEGPDMAHWQDLLALLNSKVPPFSPMDSVEILRLVLQNLAPDDVIIKNKLIISVDKAALFHAMQKMHNEIQIPLLQRCLSANTQDPLRKIFWKQTGSKLCTINNSTRKHMVAHFKEIDPYSSPKAEYYNQCLENLAEDITKRQNLPWELRFLPLSFPKIEPINDRLKGLMADFKKAVRKSEKHGCIKKTMDYGHDQLEILIKALALQGPVYTGDLGLDPETVFEAIQLFPLKKQSQLLHNHCNRDFWGQLQQGKILDKVTAYTLALQGLIKQSEGAKQAQEAKESKEEADWEVVLSPKAVASMPPTELAVADFYSMSMQEFLDKMLKADALYTSAEKEKQQHHPRTVKPGSPSLGAMADGLWKEARHCLEASYQAKVQRASSPEKAAYWQSLKKSLGEEKAYSGYLGAFHQAQTVLHTMLNNLQADDLRHISKKQILAAIPILPKADRAPLLKRCLGLGPQQTTDVLHEFFWTKKGSKECTIKNGKRKKICAELKDLEPSFNPKAEHYNQSLETFAFEMKAILDNPLGGHASAPEGPKKTADQRIAELMASFTKAIRKAAPHANAKKPENYEHLHLANLLLKIAHLATYSAQDRLGPATAFQAIQLLSLDQQAEFLQTHFKPSFWKSGGDALREKVGAYIAKFPPKVVIEAPSARTEKAPPASVSQNGRGTSFFTAFSYPAQGQGGLKQPSSREEKASGLTPLGSSPP